MGKKKEIVPSDFGFEADGIQYEFNAMEFSIPVNGDGIPEFGYASKTFTAEEAAQDEKICAWLVSVKSGVIEVSEQEAEDKEPSTVVELRAWLTEKGIEFDKKALRDDLVKLYDEHKAGGE